MPGRGGRRLIPIEKQNETLFRWIGGKPVFGSPDADNEGIQWASCKINKSIKHPVYSSPIWEPANISTEVRNTIGNIGAGIAGLAVGVFAGAALITAGGATAGVAWASGAIYGSTTWAIGAGLPSTIKPATQGTLTPGVNEIKKGKQKIKFASFNKPCTKDKHAGLF